MNTYFVCQLQCNRTPYTYQHIHVAIAVALRFCNLSFVAIRSNFHRVSTKNEGNSRLSGALEKKHTTSFSNKNTSLCRYAIHLFGASFFFNFFFSLLFLFTFRLHYIIHRKHLIGTSICNLCFRMFFDVCFF